MLNFILRVRNMIEIIPNWHPILVHFTVGLLSTSSLLYAVAYALKKENLLIVARWNLWIGVLFTIATVLAGFYGYYTVAHDTVAHVAMTNHKNWALPTAFMFMVLALWAAIKQRDAKNVHILFVVFMLGAFGILGVTGYKGAEIVYRHGMGVMRMPVIEGDGSHQHDGADTHETMSEHDGEIQTLTDTSKTKSHDTDGDNHGDDNHTH